MPSPLVRQLLNRLLLDILAYFLRLALYFARRFRYLKLLRRNTALAERPEAVVTSLAMPRARLSRNSAVLSVLFS